MFGNNPILPPKKGDGGKLEVQEIFSTFQGEGLFTGYPSVFIRLGGCNLACKFCDTEFDSYQTMALADIINEVKNLADKNNKRIYNLVVITGGEPFRQPIAMLCKKLIAENFLVQIETNGTLYQKLPAKVNIVCSPKNTGSGYHTIRGDLLPKISAFKFLVSAGNIDYQTVPEVGQSQYDIPVYLQPIDEYDKKRNQQNRKLTLKLARKHGCRISLQTHKYWGID